MLSSTALFNPILGLKHVTMHSYGTTHAGGSLLSNLMEHMGVFGTWILHGIFFRIGAEIVSHLPFMLIVIVAMAVGGLCSWNYFHKNKA
ncbi:hypothetical protein FEFB_05960 [Fructobacillus sp. EFB-N1]|uniref:hypothetical protein n=1 Tax=Fructobacillus sp. EFB-N1 TaxID=1658766 RepID=UPI00064DD851|nr:hypothetical protein [Fructobacillus sp. EFB-N1]KMK53661.1 hypothetical protein FEFB_05960 [Fructobacillus sp. EFB-N1]